MFDLHEPIVTPATMMKKALKRVISCASPARVPTARGMGSAYMGVQGGSATNVVELNAAGRREAKIVAAARVVSIDYRSIVDNAVAGLANNTPDARREVYTQARGIVKRHLQLMRLPEPIVEVEKLALDLTIRKIERQWRARQSAEKAIPDDPAERRVERTTVPQAFGSLARALAALGQALASVLIVLGLRPVVTAIVLLTSPLRVLMNPISIAAALPIIAMAIFFVFFVDNNIAYRSLLDGPAGQWLAHFDIVDIVPGARTPQSRAKTPDRLPAGTAAGVAQEPTKDPTKGPTKEPSRIAAVEAPPAVTELPPRVVAGDAAPVGPTRVRPIRAAFAAAPEAAAPAPAQMSAACGSGLSMSERMACAADSRSGGAAADAQRSAQPSWLSSYATFSGVAVERTPATPPADSPVSGDETVALALPGTAPDGAPESSEAPPTEMVPAEAPRAAAPPPPPRVLIAPANAKVTAFIDSGKRAVVKGDLERAVRDFSEAIRLDPKYPDSYSERGQAMFKLGETERAIADYSAAIQRDPQFGTALRSRGMAYLYRGTPDLALADLSKAIELTDNDPSLMAPIELFYARRSRSAIYGSKQQYDREIADCTALVESYARDPMLVEALKANYGDVGAANIVATIYRQRANAQIRRQQWQLAVADLTEAIPLSSDHGYTALMDRAKLYEGLGQRDQAIADVQNALGVRPGSEEARLALRRLGAPPKPASAGGF
jgi:Tfp pilus assembly protein PilF